ncbi:MAG: hypothetical protein BJ554DRAFT_6357 [Olpidium bornovanus]|uniref:Uncharacterized protein n=1 Tax=Olpidium bornovanus TaxID=278681 RepID=A0A8H8A1S9_9FUNG|nr:MAG: hypothetical protein BJ554DRAFT_6357 [Olpidium bornovanus]
MVQLNPLVRDQLVGLIGHKCYWTLVERLDVFDAPCRNLAVSKALGFAIVVGGSVVKLPQVLKIVNGRSAQGLSMASALLETAGYVVSLAYNIRLGNPFSTYGETLFITVQNLPRKEDRRRPSAACLSRNERDSRRRFPCQRLRNGVPANGHHTEHRPQPCAANLRELQEQKHGATFRCHSFPLLRGGYGSGVHHTAGGQGQSPPVWGSPGCFLQRLPIVSDRGFSWRDFPFCLSLFFSSLCLEF